MDSYVGKIFFESNLIFKKTGNFYNKQIDHAKTRPVLIIAESEEYLYYLKISSNIGASSTSVEIFNKYGQSKNSFVSVDQIFRKPICFIKDIQMISKNNILEILIMLKRYNEKIHKDEYYDEINAKIDELIEKYSVELDKKSKKLKLR